MKTVYPSTEIAHLWAHATQDSARNPGGNVSFAGGILYSYNTTIAVRVAPTLFVVDVGRFSITTSKHQSWVRRAIPRGATVVQCESLHAMDLQRDGWERRLAAWLVRDASEKYRQAAAKKRESFVRETLVDTAHQRLDDAMRMIQRAPRQRGMAALHRAVVNALGLPVDAWAKRAAALGEPSRAARRADAVGRAVRGWEMASDAALSLSSREHALDSLAQAVSQLQLLAKECGKRFVRPQGVPSVDQIEAVRQQVTAEIRQERRTAAMHNLRRAWQTTERAQRDTRKDTSSGAWIDHSINIASYCGIPVPARVVDLRRRLERSAVVADCEERLVALRGTATVDMPQLASWLAMYQKTVRDMAAFPPTHPINVQLSALAERSVAAEEALAEWEANRAAREAAAVDAWRAGMGSIGHTTTPLLRLVGDVVETSWGARVPAESARRLWRLLQRVRGDVEGTTQLATRLTAEGYRVGNYPLSTIRTDGSLVIGCHDIPASEVDTIAALL